MNELNLFDLSGRVAIVTGGGGLLASEHAIALHAYGAKVVLADFNEEKCIQAIEVFANTSSHASYHSLFFYSILFQWLLVHSLALKSNLFRFLHYL